MSLDIRPTLSALLRNRTGAILVALQIAIALAVLVNAIYIAEQRVQKMSRPTRIDDENLFALSSAGFTDRFNADASRQEDLAWLRSLDGVVAATPVNSTPLAGGGSGTSVWTNPGLKGLPLHVNYFETDEESIHTLGVRLLAGRAFRADEILPPVTKNNSNDWVPSIIITESLARALFPHENALGRNLYDTFGKSATIIGIIDSLIGGAYSGWSGDDYVMLEPRLPLLYGFKYMVRTQPGRRDAVMRTVEEHLSASNPDRVIQWVRTLEFMKKRLYRSDRNMAIFLVTVTGLLLAVACLGVFGLTTFNVSTRTKQIGTRRAVGARKRDILRYFMVENALITTSGIVVGCVLALAAGYWLSVAYQLPRLDLYYLVGGVLLLWAIGQFAAWQPARRASAVPPSVATRTV